MSQSDYGVTSLGFKRKTYPIIIEELRIKARELFGPDIDLSGVNILTYLIELFGWRESQVWEYMEDTYNSSYAEYATGTSLTNIGRNIGITRSMAARSSGKITIEGLEDTVIPIGFRVSIPNTEKIYQTTKGGTITSSGILELPITSLAAGADQNVPDNTITNIVNTSPGVLRVYNKEATVGGMDAESDHEFFLRYFDSLSMGGGSTTEAIRAALLSTEGVVTSEVLENTTMEEVDGLPPKSVAPYVYGGTDEDIAAVILRHKAGGIQSFGSTSVEVVDEDDKKHVVSFTRVLPEYIHIRAKVTPGKGIKPEEVMKRAIINYVGGTDSDGISYKGLRLGEDVVISRIMGSITCLGGVEDISVEISKDGSSWQSTNIIVSKDEIAATKEELVEIIYV